MVSRRRLGAARAAAGFTLVELLIAMSILSILAASVHITLAACFNLRLRYRDRLADLQADRALVAQLRDDLCNLSTCSTNLAVAGDQIALIRPAHGDSAGESGDRFELVQYRWTSSDSLPLGRAAESPGGPPAGRHRNPRFVRKRVLLSSSALERWTPEALLRSCLQRDSIQAPGDGNASDPAARSGTLEQSEWSEAGVQFFDEVASFRVLSLVSTPTGLAAGRGSAQDSVVALCIALGTGRRGQGVSRAKEQVSMPPSRVADESVSRVSEPNAYSLLESGAEPGSPTFTLALPAAHTLRAVVVDWRQP